MATTFRHTLTFSRPHLTLSLGLIVALTGLIPIIGIGQTTVASAADGSCATATNFARPTSLGSVYEVPASIDATGETDVSGALQDFLVTTVQSGTPEAPSVVRFAPGGTYRSDYSLVLGKRSSGGVSGVTWPALTPFTLHDIIIDLNGSSLVQRSSALTDTTGVADPRKRWGVPIIFTGGASGIEITNGTLWGANSNSVYSATREPWAGVTVAGNGTGIAERIWLHDLTIRNVWGDFAYVAGRAHGVRGVVIEDNIMRGAGRQGIVVNGGDNVTLRRNDITNVDRFIFDSEPSATAGWTNLFISGNTGGGGGLGYFQYAAPTAAAGSRLAIVGNTISTGNFRIRVSGSQNIVRECLLIAYNRNAGTHPFQSSLAWPQLIGVGAWSNVTVRMNADLVVPEKGILAVDVSKATDTNVGANCFFGAIDNTCLTPDTMPPSAPVPSLTALGAGALSLTWPAVTDDRGVSRYRVYRDGALVGTGTETTFSETRLSPQTTYLYEVVALDTTGNLSASGQLSVVTLADITAPSAPGSPTATVSAPDTVRLAWAAASDDVKVVGYQVTQDGVLIGTPSYLSRTVTGLTPQRSYIFTVKAVDGSGNLSSPVTMTATTPADVTPPSAVPIVSATGVTLGTITVRWAAASDDVKIASYLVYQDFGASPVASVTAGVRSATVRGLVSGRSYGYTVVAIDTSGNRGPAGIPVVTTAP